MIDYKNLSDDDLASLLSSGNDLVFKEIFQRYDKLLFLYAFKKLRNEEEAKDVVQEIFLWLFKNRETLTLNTTLSGYLYKAVLNRVFNVFKHQDIVKKYMDSGDHFIEVDSLETDFLIREKDIAQLIEQEIARLPAKMREIYLLKRRQYKTTKQIAEQLGISEHTVSTQLKNAMRHLRARLGILIYLLYLLDS